MNCFIIFLKIPHHLFWCIALKFPWCIKFIGGISGSKPGRNNDFYFCNVLTFCLNNGQYFAICKKFPLSFYNIMVHFHSPITLKLISIIGSHDITEILLKVVLSTINQTMNQPFSYNAFSWIMTSINVCILCNLYPPAPLYFVFFNDNIWK